METTKKNVCIKVTNLDQTGYGVDGKLTRQEWQDECLKMLLAGKESFNNWQKDLKQIAASNPKSNAENFDVEVSYAENLKPGIRVGWSDTPSYFVVDVINHIFEEDLFLSGYTFLTGALFSGVTFNRLVSFDNAIFEKSAYFFGTIFNNAAIFSDTTAKCFIFNNPIFGGLTSFNYSNIDGIIAECGEFQSDAHFQGVELKHASFNGALFVKKANFSGDSVTNDNKLQTFGSMSFSGAHFKERADFSNREFKGSTSFEEFEGQPTRFDVAPLFHNCKLHQDTTFGDAIFPSPSNADKFAARAYNTLRHAMSQQQSTREEQRFLRLELDAERLMAKAGERLLYRIYWKISDYGFSVWKPFRCLVLGPILFAGLFYGVLTSWNHCNSLLFSHSCQIDVELIVKTIEFSLLQSLPPLGLDKLSESLQKDLFNGSSRTSILVALVVIQKALALAGWFFVALALRNLFKMK